MSESERLNSSCECGVERTECTVTLNGEKVRCYKCPECGLFSYHPEDLQKVVAAERLRSLSQMGNNQAKIERLK